MLQVSIKLKLFEVSISTLDEVYLTFAMMWNIKLTLITKIKWNDWSFRNIFWSLLDRMELFLSKKKLHWTHFSWKFYQFERLCEIPMYASIFLSSQSSDKNGEKASCLR